MSSDGFHVHGPHDHELEHAGAHADRDARAGRIAMIAAVLATLAAVSSYQAGATQAAAALHKNDAVIRKTEAANQWAYFQAKSTKEAIAEVARLGAAPEVQRVLTDEIARYGRDKAEIERTARGFETAATDADRQAAGRMHEHHRWAQATTALQVAIAMAAIALITRRRWLLVMVYAFAAAGISLAGFALAHV